MSLFTGVAIYLTIWWTVLFAVLPLGTVSHAEAGIDKGDGGDPGAPVDPKLKQKFLLTTAIATVVFGIVWLVIWTGIVKLPSLPSGY
jgi:predicted secreted protein